MSTLELIERREAMLEQASSPFRVRKFSDTLDTLLLPSSAADPDTDPALMTARCVISVETKDRSGDIVLSKGLDILDHRVNPVVLLGHNRDWPIGKAEDSAGAYTVALGEGRVTATTYFSQSSALAAQTFALVAERILRGLSISFQPRKWLELPPDEGKPAWWIPLLFTETKLLEYSHLTLPDHAGAVVGKSLTETADRALTLLSRNRVAGQPILEPIRKALEICVPRDRSVTVVGGWSGSGHETETEKCLSTQDMAKDIAAAVVARLAESTEQKMTTATATPPTETPANTVPAPTPAQGAASTNTVPTNTVPPDFTAQINDAVFKAVAELAAKLTPPAPVSTPAPAPAVAATTAVVKAGGYADLSDRTGDEESERENWPTGAKALAGTYDRLLDGADFAAELLDQEMKSEVAAYMAEATGRVEDECAAVAELFATTYPDLPPLAERAAGEEMEVGKNYYRPRQEGPALERLLTRLKGLHDKRQRSRLCLCPAAKSLLPALASRLARVSTNLTAEQQAVCADISKTLETLALTSQDGVTREEYTQMLELQEANRKRLEALSAGLDKTKEEIDRGKKGR